MPAVKRVWTSDPGDDVLLNLPSVNVIRRAPAGPTQAAGTGVILLVGEFENGAIEAPFETFGQSDVARKSGGLGFPIDTNPHAGPVACKSGGDELWNGNGYMWLKNKVFSGLILCRVDNSAGRVQFRRLATIAASIAGPYEVTDGGTVIFSNGSTTVTSTFNATAGTLTGSSGTFPTLFVGGETIEILDGDGASRVVVFRSVDQSLSQVIDRINAVMALPIASDSGGQLRLSSSVEGAAGRIEVVGGTARATLGFPTEAVAQESTVTINSNTGGGPFVLTLTRVVNGVSTDYAGSYTAGVGDSEEVVRDGVLANLLSLGIPDISLEEDGTADIVISAPENISYSLAVTDEPDTGDMTFTTDQAAVLTVGVGLGNVQNRVLVSEQEAAAVFDAAANIGAYVGTDGLPRVTNTQAPATGQLGATGGTLLSAFGFPSGLVSAANGPDMTILAGTRVYDPTAGTAWLTIEDVPTGTGGGPWDARVRPFVDDDTALASAISGVTTIMDVMDEGFAVTNAAAITRLSAAQLDARYIRAIGSTLGRSSPAARANVICSARSSVAINRALRANARAATAAGLAGRKFVVRPPLGTDRDVARGSTGHGVGNVGRDSLGVYAFPGWRIYVPELALVGSAQGGTGFADDGIVDVGSDSFYASIRSLLNPEENAGQALRDTNVGELDVVGLESAYDSTTGGIDLEDEDYIAFQAAGICAPVMDQDDGPGYMSDVTSVDPLVSPGLEDANRQYLNDMVSDTVLRIGKRYSKKLTSQARLLGLRTSLEDFLDGLHSPLQPNNQRIADYLITNVTTPTQLARGLVRIKVVVRMLSTFKSIAFELEVGTNTVTVSAAAA